MINLRRYPPEEQDGLPIPSSALSPWPKVKWSFGNHVKSLTCGKSCFGNVLCFLHWYEQVVLIEWPHAFPETVLISNIWFGQPYKHTRTMFPQFFVQ